MDRVPAQMLPLERASESLVDPKLPPFVSENALRRSSLVRELILPRSSRARVLQSGGGVSFGARK
jgi:hypothetical protein